MITLLSQYLLHKSLYKKNNSEIETVNIATEQSTEDDTNPYQLETPSSSQEFEYIHNTLSWVDFFHNKLLEPETQIHYFYRIISQLKYKKEQLEKRYYRRLEYYPVCIQRDYHKALKYIATLEREINETHTFILDIISYCTHNQAEIKTSLEDCLENEHFNRFGSKLQHMQSDAIQLHVATLANNQGDTSVRGITTLLRAINHFVHKHTYPPITYITKSASNTILTHSFTTDTYVTRKNPSIPMDMTYWLLHTPTHPAAQKYI